MIINKIKKIGIFVCSMAAGVLLFDQSCFAGQHGKIIVKYNTEQEELPCDEEERIGQILERSKLLKDKKVIIMSNRNGHPIMPANTVKFYNLLNGSLYAFERNKEVKLVDIAAKGVSGLVRYNKFSDMQESLKNSMLLNNTCLFPRIRENFNNLKDYEKAKLSKIPKLRFLGTLGDYRLYNDSKDLVGYKDNNSPVFFVSARPGKSIDRNVLPEDLTTFDFTTEHKTYTKKPKNEMSSISMQHLPKGNFNLLAKTNNSSQSMSNLNWSRKPAPRPYERKFDINQPF